LGLYIAEQIVVAHGGTIGVESNQTARTNFVAELPRG
jgi:signal transduction histidine kinase